MFRIISKKRYNDIKVKEKQNERLMRGWEAINRTLDYESAIIAILETLNLKEVTVDNYSLYMPKGNLEIAETPDYKTIIRVRK